VHTRHILNRRPDHVPCHHRYPTRLIVPLVDVLQAGGGQQCNADDVSRDEREGKQRPVEPARKFHCLMIYSSRLLDYLYHLPYFNFPFHFVPSNPFTSAGCLSFRHPSLHHHLFIASSSCSCDCIAVFGIVSNDCTIMYPLILLNNVVSFAWQQTRSIVSLCSHSCFTRLVTLHYPC
jgi:hypothetical protein